MKSTCEILFTVSVHEILQLVHEISSFKELLFKIGDLKNSSKLQVNTGSSHSEVFYKKILKTLQNSEKNVFAGVSSLIKLRAGNVKMSEAAAGDVL